VLKRERQVLVKEKARTRAGVFSPSRHSTIALSTTAPRSKHVKIMVIIKPIGRGFGGSLKTIINKKSQ
jgi:hypothetical protein